MSHHAKAASAGFRDGDGNNRRGLYPRAATRDDSAGTAGSGASVGPLRAVLALAALAVLAMAIFASPASAASGAIGTVSAVSYTSVHAKGEVIDPIGDTFWRFDVSRDGGATWEGAHGPTASGGPVTTTTPVEGDLLELKPGTEYQVRFVVYDTATPEFETYSPEPNPTFTTLAVAPPVVTVSPAFSITGAGASFKGTVDPNGTDAAFDANCEFDYVPVARNERQRLNVEAQEGTYKLAFEGQETEAIAFDASAATVEEQLSALSGIGVGNVAVSGGTGIHPYVITFGGAFAAKDVAEVSTVLGYYDTIFLFHSTLVGSATVSTSLQGNDGAFASAVGTFCGDNPITGTDPVPVEAAVTGLEPSTAYHLRLRATNLGGAGISEAPDFTTSAVAPAVLKSAVSHVKGNSARLEAEINSGGAATTYHFEYMTLEEFEDAGGLFTGAAATPESESIGADNEGQLAFADISGLQEDTPYRYRVVANNSESAPGGTFGPVRSFRTTGTGPPVSESCPNAAIRAEQGATYLPECRGFEIVSDPSLGLGDVAAVPSTDDQHAVYATQNPTDSARGAAVWSYAVARRTASGWESQSADPVSYGPVAANSGSTDFQVASPDFSELLFTTSLPTGPDDLDSGVDVLRVGVDGGATTLMSPGVEGRGVSVIGATADLKRVTFYAPGAGGTQIVQSDEISADKVSVTTDGLDPVEGPGPFLSVGDATARGVGEGFEEESTFVPNGGQHAISDDGRRSYFLRLRGVVGADILVRDLASDPPRTVYVTISERTADAGKTVVERLNLGGGQFISASHDGSQAYFVSGAQLTDDAPVGGGIYRFDLEAIDPDHRLELITPDAGQPSGLGLTSAVPSDDQSHIYFTATSALAPGAVAGDLNAYVWTAAGGTRFIADVTGGGSGFQRVTADGGYALLVSTASIEGAPNNGKQAIYQYDYAADQLTCISCRPDGSPSQGRAVFFGDTVALRAIINNNRALISDGRVLFSSFDQLVPEDQTAAADVYLYHDGTVSLISTGTEKTNSFSSDISEDGKNVTFVTRAALVGADRDVSEYDVYSAYLGGGFPEPPPPAAPCEGEGCRGASSSPPAGVTATTPNFIGPGNPPKCGKGKIRRNGRCVKQKARKHSKKHASKRKTQKRDVNANGRTGR